MPTSALSRRVLSTTVLTATAAVGALLATAAPAVAATAPTTTATVRPAGITPLQWSQLHDPATHRAMLAHLIAVGLLKAPQPVAAARSAVPAAVRALDWPALARCESSGNPRAVSPSGDMGLYQFNQRTWTAIGGHGSPVQNTAAEQTLRAQLLYVQRGAAPWPTCGRRLAS